jgi:hypothetical protein
MGKRKNQQGELTGAFTRSSDIWAKGMSQRQPFPDHVLSADDYIEFLEHLRVNPDISVEKLKKIPFIMSVRNAMATDAIEAAKTLKKAIGPFLVNTANNQLLQAGCNDQLKANSFRLADTKSTNRFLTKTVSYGGDFTRVRDVTRCEIVAETNDQIACLCATLEHLHRTKALLPGGAVISYTENRFLIPTATGYRSFQAFVNIPLQDENGLYHPDRYHIVEVMVRHKDFEREIKANKRNSLGKDSHQIYEDVRTIEERYQDDPMPNHIAKWLQKASATVRKLHDDSARVAKIDQPIDFKRFLQGLLNGWHRASPKANPEPNHG